MNWAGLLIYLVLGSVALSDMDKRECLSELEPLERAAVYAVWPAFVSDWELKSCETGGADE